MARRILIVDRDASHRIAFKAALAAARYNAAAAENGRGALERLDKGGIDVLIVAADLPDLATSGLVDRIGAPACGDPPCLVVMQRDDSDLRAEWIEAGAALTMVQPVARPCLLSNLRALLRAHDTRQELDRQKQTAARIGLLDQVASTPRTPRIDVVARDRQAAGRLLRGLPDRLGFIAQARTPEGCLSAAEEGSPPDLILLAEDETGEETLWLVSEIRSNPNLRRVALVVEYDPTDPMRGARSLDVGANALVSRDAGLSERVAILKRELRWKLESDTKRAQFDASLELAATDPLTGLWNRRYAMHYLDDLAARRSQDGRGYGVILADIDHFKAVNDTYGHGTGDAILSEVAHRLQSHVRAHDLVARIGGEEFLIAISDTSDSEILTAAERLRDAISARPVKVGTLDIPVSISLGAARGRNEEPRNAKTTVEVADTALYRAKAGGRDCSRLATDADRALVDHRRGTAMLDGTAERRSQPPKFVRQTAAG